MPNSDDDDPPTNLDPPSLPIRSLTIEEREEAVKRKSLSLAELRWAIVFSVILVVVDVLARVVRGQTDLELFDLSTTAYALFALSATGIARSIQNESNREHSYFLIFALIVQMVIAVLTSGGVQAHNVFVWLVLAASAILMFVGIFLTWWPGARDRKSGSRTT